MFGNRGMDTLLPTKEKSSAIKDLLVKRKAVAVEAVGDAEENKKRKMELKERALKKIRSKK